MFGFSRKSLLGEFGARSGNGDGQGAGGQGAFGQEGQRGGNVPMQQNAEGNFPLPPPRKPAMTQEERQVGCGTGCSDFKTPYKFVSPEELADVALEGYDMPEPDETTSDMGSFKMTPSEARLRSASRHAKAARAQARTGQEAQEYADDMSGYDASQGMEQDPEDIVAQTKETPEIKAHYEQWNKRREAIQSGYDSGDPQSFEDTYKYIKAHKDDPKFMNMLHPQTVWMTNAYEDALKEGKSVEEARDAAYEIGAYRYMDEEAMGSLNKAGQEIKTGLSTLWGADADAAAYDAIANDPSIPQVYKDRLLTQIAGKGTEYAIDAATTFTPVGRAVGMVQNFGKGRLDAKKRGADFWGQVGGGALHVGVNTVTGKAGKYVKKGSGKVIDKVMSGKGNQAVRRGLASTIKNFGDIAIDIGAQEVAGQTKSRVADRLYGRPKNVGKAKY